jgi:EpsI family protein
LRVWRWYWVNDTYTASDAVAKLQGAFGRLRFWGDDGAIIAVYTPLDTTLPEPQAREQADARLGQFVRDHGAALQAALRARHGGH